jgi:hypothetical protein
MIKAVRIENIVRKGSSTPIIAADENGSLHFVKAKGAGDGLTALISDWIVTSIGNLLGLSILKPEIILLDESSKVLYPHGEIKDLIKRSYGYNLSYEYYPDAQIYNFVSPQKDFSKEIKDLIFLFDSFFVNIDRTKENPNIFISGENIFASDFGASFLIKEIFDGISYCLNPEIQKLLKRNIFYNENAEVNNFLSKLQSIDKKILEQIVFDFPDEWIAGSKLSKKNLYKKLSSFIYDENHLLKALEVLKTIEVPTDEELRLQRLANKKKFEDEIFKNVVPLMPESKRY